MDKINIGRMSITSIAMLYAILKGKGERVSAVEITKELGLESGRLGGGWTTLTQKTRERPAFLIKAGAFTRRNKGGKATGKGWYWMLRRTYRCRHKQDHEQHQHLLL